MAAPEGSPEFFEFRKQFVRGLSLERLDQFAYREEGWHGDEEMDVIFRNGAFDYVDVVPLAYLPYKLPEPFCHLSIEYLLSVFRTPHHVVPDVIDRMRSFPVVLHLLMLLKSSPKGEGFPPRRGH